VGGAIKAERERIERGLERSPNLGPARYGGAEFELAVAQVAVEKKEI